MTKITKAQRELLTQAAADQEGAVDAPADAKISRPLIKQRLAISLPVTGGVSRLIITAAGRALLDETEAANGEAPAAAEQDGPEPAAEAGANRGKAAEPPAASDTPNDGAPAEVEQDGPALPAETGAEREGAPEPQAASDSPEGAASGEGESREAPSTGKSADTHPSKPLPGGKLGKLVELLRRPGGATLDEMVAATGWLTHSVRGAMSGGLKKKLGLTIVSIKTDGTRVYRITTGEAA